LPAAVAGSGLPGGLAAPVVEEVASDRLETAGGSSLLRRRRRSPVELVESPRGRRVVADALALEEKEGVVPGRRRQLPVVAAGAGSGMPGENIRTWVKDVPEKFLKLFLRLSTKPCG
jgi:hypothetical protein